jgi:hypothetical protein
MKKTIYTLNFDNYAPEICALTYPLLRHYADKINAEFVVISERKWPQCHFNIERLQIYDLARERGDDWTIFFDSDALVHPDTPDVTEMVPMDTVLHNADEYASCRFIYDDYFRRDGRHIATGNWFTVASRWCLDLWHPLEDLTVEEAIQRIKPLAKERRNGMPREHIIDDFIISRNVARYGLKATTFRSILARIGHNDKEYLWHQSLISNAHKLFAIKSVLQTWTGGAFELRGLDALLDGPVLVKGVHG